MGRLASDISLAELSPEEKLHILKAMGFTENAPHEHARGCAHLVDNGLRCGCIPPVTNWTAPADVRGYMGESDKARKAFAEKRQEYLNDGDGEDPGPWSYHLTKTALRYRR